MTPGFAGVAFWEAELYLDPPLKYELKVITGGVYGEDHVAQRQRKKDGG